MTCYLLITKIPYFWYMIGFPKDWLSLVKHQSFFDRSVWFCLYHKFPIPPLLATHFLFYSVFSFFFFSFWFLQNIFQFTKWDFCCIAQSPYKKSLWIFSNLSPTTFDIWNKGKASYRLGGLAKCFNSMWSFVLGDMLTWHCALTLLALCLLFPCPRF